MSLKKIFLKILVLTLIVTSFIGCKNKKDNSLLHTINENINTKINTKFLTDITTLNLKIISISKNTKNLAELENTKNIINSIEETHIAINKKIKKIAVKNLIIIPDVVYVSEKTTDTLNTNRDYVYLIKIKQLLQEENQKYLKIKNQTQSEEIKDLANESITHLKIKLNEIKLVLN